jgi:hypothetical protein
MRESDGPRLASVLERVRGLKSVRMKLAQYPELELYQVP